MLALAVCCWCVKVFEMRMLGAAEWKQEHTLTRVYGIETAEAWLYVSSLQSAHFDASFASCVLFGSV